MRFMRHLLLFQNINRSIAEQRCRKTTLRNDGNCRGGAYASGGLERRRQGTWMGARRRKRGRIAGNAAKAGRSRGWQGTHATAGVGLVSHRQQAMMNANSTLFSL
jgi:hypothetical protein